MTAVPSGASPEPNVHSRDPDLSMEAPPPSSGHAVKTRLTISDEFCEWLAREQTSIVFSTYQTGKVCVLSAADRAAIHYHEQPFSRALGIVATDTTLYVAALSVVWRLENALNPGERDQDTFDRLYVPRMAFITGDLDVHEIAIDGARRPMFVNTKYSCLAALSDMHSFEPIWKPKFVSKLLPEDRCHLNGIALADGEPAYVTLLGPSDVVEGWRARRADGGMLIDVRNDDVVADTLSLPHSPRLYDGRILLLESGRGYLVSLDPQTGAKEDIAFCPGFLRGLAVHNGYALVTTSTPREGLFTDLALERELKARNIGARCTICLVDLKRGRLAGAVTFGEGIAELFGIDVLPGIMRPMLEGPTTAQLGSRHCIGPFRTAAHS